MGYWVELHCDLNVWQKCRNAENEVPGGLFERLSGSATLLHAAAKKLGWIKQDGLWVCDLCQKAREPAEPPPRPPK